MPEIDPFEARFAARLAAHAASGTRPINEESVARAVAMSTASAPRHRAGDVLGRFLATRPVLAWALLLALLLALAATALVVGALLQRGPDPLGGSDLLIGRQTGIYIDPRDGTQVQSLREDGTYVYPRWSPTGQYIAASFIAESGAAIGDPGANTMRILRAAGEPLSHVDGVAAFAWSPVADRLAIRLLASGPGPLVVVAPDGSLVALPVQWSAFPDDAPNIRGFAWSPDGRRIVASICTSCPANGSRSPETRDDLWILDFTDAGTSTRLTDTPGDTEGGVAWSPDSSAIAFTVQPCADGIAERGVRCSGQLWLLDLADRVPRQIAAGVAPFEEGPAWSPDSARLAFAGASGAANDAAARDIFVVDRNGERLIQLTFQHSNVALPRWSEDGHWIIYWRYLASPSGILDVWAVAAEGSQPVRLASDTIGADWRPVASAAPSAD